MNFGAFVHQTVNADRFSSFCQQLSEFTQALSGERSAIDKAIRQMETQQLQAETAFDERVSEEKIKFAAQKDDLKKQLQALTAVDDKLSVQKKEWEEKQERAYGNLMAQLENDEMTTADTRLGDQFSLLINSMINLSYESINDQFTVLKNNLDALSIEKKQLEIAIADLSSTISEMLPKLQPTCGVTYKERNALRILFLNQVSKVRSEYQKCRLQEEELKAKLSI